MSNKLIKQRESPDFEIVIENRKIGIEITEYYIDADRDKGSSLQASLKYDGELQKTIKDTTERNPSLKGINGALFFKDQTRPRKAELNEFCDEIIKFAVESIHNKDFEQEMDFKPTDNYRLLKKYLQFSSLQRSIPPPLWLIPGTSRTNFDENKLISMLKLKIEKGHNYYSNNFSELWLLVIFGSLPSQTITISNLEETLKSSNSVDKMLKSSYFNKVYFYLSDYKTVFVWPEWIKIKSRIS